MVPSLVTNQSRAIWGNLRFKLEPNYRTLSISNSLGHTISLNTSSNESGDPNSLESVTSQCLASPEFEELLIAVSWCGITSIELQSLVKETIALLYPEAARASCFRQEYKKRGYI
jgi:hypothetical protein